MIKHIANPNEGYQENWRLQFDIQLKTSTFVHLVNGYSVNPFLQSIRAVLNYGQELLTDCCKMKTATSKTLVRSFCHIASCD